MKSLLLLCSALLTMASFGQQIITGTISDRDGVLPFANIIVKNSTHGVHADDFGNFSIKVKLTDTLQVRSLGYRTKYVSVGTQSNFEIVLDDYEQLESVYITAYSEKTSCRYIICCKKRGCGNHIEESKKIKPLKIALDDSVKLFPNPSRDGKFNVAALDDIFEVKVVVVDLTGRVIIQSVYKDFDSRVTIDLSNQPSGIYVVNIVADGGQLRSKKVIRM